MHTSSPATAPTLERSCIVAIDLAAALRPEEVPMTPGDAGSTPARRTTLSDVARVAGVSTALVSLVMRGAPGASPANREKVFRVARELGYVPDSRARALRQGRSQLLGVMFG